jgi:hypothetical protein
LFTLLCIVALIATVFAIAMLLGSAFEGDTFAVVWLMLGGLNNAIEFVFWLLAEICKGLGGSSE